MTRDDLQVIARFNGANGGVSLIIKGNHDEKRGLVIGGAGAFLSPADALELAAELIEKALASRNNHLMGPEVTDAIACARNLARNPKL